MASVKVRKEGQWWRVIVDAREDGEGRKRVSKHRTEQAATKAAARFEDELAEGQFIDPKLTVAEVFDLWLDSAEVADLRDSTAKRYRQIVRDYGKPGLGDVRVRRLTGDQIDKWLREDARRNGLSVATQRQHYATLHRSLAWAVKKGRIGYNPATRAHRPGEPEHRTTFLEMDDARRMLAELAVTHNGDPQEARSGVRTAVGGPSVLYVPVLLALATGARRGEILSLTWRDVDLKTRRVTIRKSKTKAGERTVTLPAWAVGPLQDAKRRQRAALREMDIFLTNDHPVCAPWHHGARGEGMNPDSLSGLFRRWADRHGYVGVRFHDLRHTHAGWLIAKGVHAKTIQDRLGHKSFSFTMDVYGGLIDGLEEQAADALDDPTLPAQSQSGTNMAIRPAEEG